jgi:fido (protein-threonine AMPylation protein)
MAGRPEAGPGAWKALPNRAGDTLFVEPSLVEGTIRRGWEIARTLTLPFQRAAMVMFAVAEVHPFTDGNGRVARAFLNAELVAGGERRIIFPSVFRDDYLGALRALTRQDHPTPYLLMLTEAQRFTHSVRWDSWEAARADLEAAAAFARPEPGVRLRIPRGAV